MIYFHLNTTQKRREGTYRIRLYSVPVGTAVRLASHWSYILIADRSAGTPGGVMLPKGVLDPLPELSVEAESEFNQGVPKLSTQKLSGIADPLLMQLVKAVRATDTEVWCEIVLDQNVLDAPERPKNGSLVWPRKRKLYYWGRLDRATLTGHVTAQRMRKNTVKGSRVVQADRTHLGNVSMEFVHWLKVRGSQPVVDFLNAFYDGTHDYARLDSLFYELLLAMSPTDRCVVSDKRMIPSVIWHKQPGLLPEFMLPFIVGQAPNQGYKLLGNLMVRMTIGGFHSALFYNDPSGSNDQSFYRWKDFAQALTEFSREFFLAPQVEIPTLEEGFNGEGSDDVTGLTRFLFMPVIGKPALKVYIDWDNDSIDYTPSATFASSYKVDQPSAGDTLLPTPSYAIAKSKLAEGSEQQYKTLFRFIGKSYQNNILTDDARGWEIYVDDYTTPHNVVPARWVANLDVTESWTNWAAFHAAMRISLWGSVRSTITIKGDGVGLEPFGASATVDSVPIAKPTKTFENWDYSDFPLYRMIDMQPGLMTNADDDTPSTYVTISVKRTPGAGIELKLLEIGAGESGEGDYSETTDAPIPPAPPLPPTTPPTTDITKPSLTAPSASGAAYNVKVTATPGDVTATIAQVSVYVDNHLIDTRSAPLVSGTTEYQFTWDTTTVANGSHTLTAKAWDNYGNSSIVTRAVSVTN